jgi:hypothetical protein
MSHNKHVLYDTAKAWLPLGVAIVVLTGLVYVIVQQNYRMSANDPQIQIAEDIAAAIAKGQPADGIVPATGTTEISQSLSPFVIIYDDNGKLIGSSAILNGKNPSYPTGVFDNVKKSGEARVTWQPEAGVRMATVVTRYTGTASGYVIAGRSLKEVEKRISQSLALSLLGGAAALVLSFLAMFFLKKKEHHYHEHPEATEGAI